MGVGEDRRPVVVALPYFITSFIRSNKMDNVLAWFEETLRLRYEALRTLPPTKRSDAPFY